MLERGCNCGILWCKWEKIESTYVETKWHYLQNVKYTEHNMTLAYLHILVIYISHDNFHDYGN